MTQGTSEDDRAQVYIDRAASLSERVDVKPGPGNERAYTDAMIAEMRASELLAITVSARLGGPELGVAAVAAITHEIARQSGSAGLVYAMHMSQALSLTVHADPEDAWFEALQRRMLSEQLLIASGTSEKGPGGDILTSICSTEPKGDGFEVVKETPNISYIDHADLILVTANHGPEGTRSKQVLIAAEVDRDAFEAGRDLALMGMRGILNRPWKFTVRFGPEAIFAADFRAIARQTMTPSIQIFWAALWSGVTWSALERARIFVGQEIDPKSEAGAVVNHSLTRLVDKHHAMNAMIRDAVAAYERSGASRDMGFDLSAQINRVKVNCSELAVEICTGALNLIGLRAYALDGPYSLAEHIADILSGPIMVSNIRLSMNNAKIERFVSEKLY